MQRAIPEIPREPRFKFSPPRVFPPLEAPPSAEYASLLAEFQQMAGAPVAGGPHYKSRPPFAGPRPEVRSRSLPESRGVFTIPMEPAFQSVLAVSRQASVRGRYPDSRLSLLVDPYQDAPYAALGALPADQR